MGSLSLIVGTGILATLAMTGTLLLIGRSKLGRSAFFWPLSGLFFDDPEKSRRLGVLAHLIGGMFFTIVYLGIWSVFSVESPFLYILLGGITGLIHGIIIGVGLISVLFDQGNQGFNIGVSQAVSHVVFGLVVGLCAAGMHLGGDTMEKVGRVVHSTIILAGR